MKLSPVALAVSAAFVWGAAIFVIGGLNSFVPGYGDAVLALVVSIYPGFDADGSLPDLLLGTAYAAFDGLAAGLVFALLYNAVARLVASDATADRQGADVSSGPSGDPGPEADPEAGESAAPDDGPAVEDHPEA